MRARARTHTHTHTHTTARKHHVCLIVSIQLQELRALQAKEGSLKNAAMDFKSRIERCMRGLAEIHEKKLKQDQMRAR